MINLYNFSIKGIDYLLFYDKTIKKFIIKFLSGRLNLKPYSRLSKEVKDFKNLWDKYIYI